MIKFRIICNAVYKQNTKEKCMKGCIFLFSKKGDLETTKNFKGIPVTAITAKVYYVLLLNRI